MPLKTSFHQNHGYTEQKMYFWTLQRGSNNKKCINWHLFGYQNIFENDIFRAAPIGLC